MIQRLILPLLLQLLFFLSETSSSFIIFPNAITQHHHFFNTHYYFSIKQHRRQQNYYQQLKMTPSNQQKSEFIASWEPEMARHIFDNYKEQTTSPFIVAVVGIPGSGKSSSSEILSRLLQEMITKTHHDAAVLVMPMDGYHLPMSTLKSKPNSKDLIYRRGAPDTFDPHSLLNDLKQIKNINESIVPNKGDSHNNVVEIPGFDHAIGDPQPSTYTFHRKQHDIVICEGLYLLHQDENIGWSKDIQNQFDLTIFINANLDTCIERLKVRNKCIPGYTSEEIDIRCDVVDRSNAMIVLESKDRAMYVVDSIVAS